MQMHSSYSRARRLLLQGVIALSIAIISMTASILLSIPANQLTHVTKAGLVDPQPDAPVTCDNKPMTTDEICEHITKINSATIKLDKTYAEQKKIQSDARVEALVEKKNNDIDQQKQTLSYIGIPLSVVFLVSLIASIVLFVNSLSARRKAQLAKKASA